MVGMLKIIFSAQNFTTKNRLVLGFFNAQYFVI